jgi:hypothetical protein
VEDEQVGFDLHCEENGKSYEEGDKTALLRMLVHCAFYRRTMPEWAVSAVVSIYRAALAGEIRSWNDVFGRPWQQERPRAQRRSLRTRTWKWEVWKRVHELHKGEGKPIDNKLFEEVGKQLAIGGKSTVAALYGEAEQAFRRVLGSNDSSNAGQGRRRQPARLQLSTNPERRGAAGAASADVGLHSTPSGAA